FTVVLRSTVLPGTTERVLTPNLLEGAGPHCQCRVHVAVHPEFMREGSSLADFARPPFTLVGSADPAPASTLRSLHAGGEALLGTTLTPTAAELPRGVAAVLATR